ILLRTPLVADLIRKGEVGEIKNVMARSRDLGMQTFDQALFDLYQAGKISEEVAMVHADSANELRMMIKFSSGTSDMRANQQIAQVLSLRDDGDFEPGCHSGGIDTTQNPRAGSAGDAWQVAREPL